MKEFLVTTVTFIVMHCLVEIVTISLGEGILGDNSDFYSDTLLDENSGYRSW